jgi:hypothetical protein
MFSAKTGNLSMIVTSSMVFRPHRQRPLLFFVRTDGEKTNYAAAFRRPPADYHSIGIIAFASVVRLLYD